MPAWAFETARANLEVQRLVCGDGFVVDDVRCRASCGGWSEPEPPDGCALVFTRTGCFTRRVNGVETLIDATAVYLRAPGEEQQVAHPADCGDRCTSIGLEPPFVASVWADDLARLQGAIFSGSELDLAHRCLLASCRTGADAADVEELVYQVVAAAFAQHDASRVDSGRPASAAERWRLVSAARSLLAHDPKRTLAGLARELAVSPHHLSRIFSAAVGVSITTYRNRLRARAALERIADGERSLTLLAVELGFADHAHLTRTLARQTGVTPSGYRSLWTATRAREQTQTFKRGRQSS